MHSTSEHCLTSTSLSVHPRSKPVCVRVCHNTYHFAPIQEYIVRERRDTAAAAAAVQYVYDAERHVQMRSCATQAHGNTAAVQADVKVLTMAGKPLLLRA